jgi:hypothetical protein
MKSHVDSLFAFFVYLLQCLFGHAVDPTDPGDAGSGGAGAAGEVAVAGAGAGAGGAGAGSAGEPAEPEPPTPEEYCALPPEDECYPCGAAGDSVLVLRLEDACATTCDAIVDALGPDCTGRCTDEGRCIVNCPPALECAAFDPDEPECEEQCGTGGGGRVYKRTARCVATTCRDALSGISPGCHGVCTSTNVCKLEC